jgi:hypothetical protein
MSKIFLGLSFVVAGIALLVLQLMMRFSANVPVVPVCAGALLGAGGVLVVWHLADHIAACHASRLPNR